MQLSVVIAIAIQNLITVITSESEGILLASAAGYLHCEDGRRGVQKKRGSLGGCCPPAKPPMRGSGGTLPPSQKPGGFGGQRPPAQTEKYVFSIVCISLLQRCLWPFHLRPLAMGCALGMHWGFESWPLSTGAKTYSRPKQLRMATTSWSRRDGIVTSSFVVAMLSRRRRNAFAMALRGQPWSAVTPGFREWCIEVLSHGSFRLELNPTGGQS